MNYYFDVDLNEKPLVVARIASAVDRDFVSERFDPKKKKWVYDPYVMYSISGTGGDGEQWRLTDEAKALVFIEASVRKYNDNHEPAGDLESGRFSPGEGRAEEKKLAEDDQKKSPTE